MNNKSVTESLGVDPREGLSAVPALRAVAQPQVGSGLEVAASIESCTLQLSGELKLSWRGDTR